MVVLTSNHILRKRIMKLIGSINEVQAILLNIIKEFDRVCTKHGIPYYMLGGTLLGAIRHKGFIPWDDDIDVGVPIEYYEQLVELLNKELPSPYCVYTFKTHKGCGTAYAKVGDNSTIIDDPRMNRIPLDGQIGINMDLFPLNSCEQDDSRIKELQNLKNRYALIYIGNSSKTRWKNILKTILRMLDSHGENYYLQREIEVAKTIKGKSCMANLFGRYGKKEIVPIDYFGKPVRYEFENITLCGVANYDAYLKSIYGNYMQLPPEEQRVAHIDNVYIK